MSKVIIFSRAFPAYHPKAGEPTYFVEKIWAYFLQKNSPMFPWWMKAMEDRGIASVRDSYDYNPKLHTIRAGYRWKVGDKFSPRVWSGKPYASKQITIAPDMEVKKVWDFEIDENGVIAIGGKYYFDEIDEFGFVGYEILAANDGLSERDFLGWFKYPQPFDGQIICWDENVKY
jgi:hypothetical protein